MKANLGTWVARGVFTALVAVSLWALLSNEFGDFIGKTAIQSDKLNHVIIFYVLTVVGLASFPSASVARFGVLLVIAGIGVEFAQSYVGREFGGVDALANAVGVILATLPIYISKPSRFSVARGHYPR